jgi:hypothetical protein
MKSFESWTYEDVELTFKIKKDKQSQLLLDWISSYSEIKEIYKKFIDELKEKLRDNAGAWNEDELKMQFIAPFLNIAHFTTEKYKPFSQRSLTLKTEKIETSGLVDFMIATGKVRPREPFFFLHEYKAHHPSKKNDPLGQLLIAMVAAQEKNLIKHPIYGVVVEGRFWYFVILHQKEYSVSRPYDAGENDIYQIYTILCKVKDYIEEILARQEAK